MTEILPKKEEKLISSKPVNWWNFHKADWKQYSRITDLLSSDLPSPDTTKLDEAYQEFCRALFSAVKKTIPRGRRRNYTPCWNEECESLYKGFTACTKTRVRKDCFCFVAKTRRREDSLDPSKRWNEAVQSIDFTHSIRRAWSIIKNLTGHSRHPPRQCPISANAIASQLIRKEKYMTRDRETTRLVREETSKLWKIPTPDDYSLTRKFSPAEFATALQKLKSGQVLVLTKYVPNLYSMLDPPSNPGCANFSLPACATSGFQKFEDVLR